MHGTSFEEKEFIFSDYFKLLVFPPSDKAKTLAVSIRSKVPSVEVGKEKFTPLVLPSVCLFNSY